jgi:hypothetical protein
MHKFGVALTIILLIVGFWDVKGIYDSDLFQNTAMPLAGLAAIVTGMKFALNRS